MPSLVGEIGDVIETHLKTIGLLKGDELDEHQQKLIADKRAQYEATRATPQPAADDDSAFPDGAELCLKCQTKAMIQMDGCLTCLNCGESKCG
jgi:hypothetical protein